MESKKLENSVRYGPIILWAFLSALFYFISVVVVSIRNGSLARDIGIICGLVIFGIIFFVAGPNRYYLKRPKSVEISDEGVRLNMRLGMQSVFIAWPDILIMYTETDIWGHDDGFICNDIRWFYPIDYPIILELRSAYQERLGKYPPTRWDDICPGMERDMFNMTASQWVSKYERSNKK